MIFLRHVVYKWSWKLAQPFPKVYIQIRSEYCHNPLGTCLATTTPSSSGGRKRSRPSKPYGLPIFLVVQESIHRHHNKFCVATLCWLLYCILTCSPVSDCFFLKVVCINAMGFYVRYVPSPSKKLTSVRPSIADPISPFIWSTINLCCIYMVHTLCRVWFLCIWEKN
jgi:hypothetical protein